jgi:hypothetical protein
MVLDKSDAVKDSNWSVVVGKANHNLSDCSLEVTFPIDMDAIFVSIRQAFRPALWKGSSLFAPETTFQPQSIPPEPPLAPIRHYKPQKP